jgi:hypothetical protein
MIGNNNIKNIDSLCDSDLGYVMHINLNSNRIEDLSVFCKGNLNNL